MVGKLVSRYNIFCNLSIHQIVLAQKFPSSGAFGDFPNSGLMIRFVSNCPQNILECNNDIL